MRMGLGKSEAEISLNSNAYLLIFTHFSAWPVCGAHDEALARLLEQPVQDVALALACPAAHCHHP